MDGGLKIYDKVRNKASLSMCTVCNGEKAIKKDSDLGIRKLNSDESILDLLNIYKCFNTGQILNGID